MSRKRRRTKGSGSVYTRKDGRVVGEYEVNGKTRYIYGKDETEVADRVAEAIKYRDGGIDSENMTVGGCRVNDGEPKSGIDEERLRFEWGVTYPPREFLTV